MLDNFEQVLPAASALTDLLNACPHLKLLVTSRAVLGIPGEHVVDIRPFLLPALPPEGRESQAAGFDVCRLFVDRAQALEPEFTFTSANAGTIVSICQRVDGLPLLSSWRPHGFPCFPPAELLAQLESRLALPGSDTPGTHQRQRTMRDAIAWSYGLLNPFADAVSKTLSIHRGARRREGRLRLWRAGHLAGIADAGLEQPCPANGCTRRRVTVHDAGTRSRVRPRVPPDEREVDTVRQRYAYYLALARAVEADLNTHERDAGLDR